MRRLLGRPALALPLAAVLVAGALVAWIAHELNAPYASWTGDGVTVDLPSGLDAGSMLERLHARGVLRHPRVVKLWLVVRGGADRLKAGEYRFERPLSPLDVLGKLSRGEVLLHPITLPEGLTLGEVAARLERAGFGEARRFEEAFSRPDAVRSFDPEAEDLEGYLFPDTYHFPRGVTAEEIVRALVGRFVEVTGPDYPVRAAEAGLSVREAVVLGSLIEKETSIAEERWRISRVFHNRLHKGMKLQCDPTVIYALERAGRPVSRLGYADLEFDSPWNTYRVYGLPPGPICNPGRDSLDAAVRPAPGDELYFVASPGGGHEFSESLSAHLEAVRRWRRHQRSER